MESFNPHPDRESLDKRLEKYGNFKNQLQAAVDQDRNIRIKSYTVSDDIELKIDAVIHMILEKMERLDLKPLVYTVLKELLVNGTRANHKRIFFQEEGLNISDPEDYENGMPLYRSRLNDEWADHYGQIARDKDIPVETTFRYSHDGLSAEVLNYADLTPQEEERLRSKLGLVMQYNTMIDFFMNQSDETEGAGLGLAMIITMLKAENINANFFRIFSREGTTKARIEIPFSDRFVSVRETGPVEVLA